MRVLQIIKFTSLEEKLQKEVLDFLHGHMLQTAMVGETLYTNYAQILPNVFESVQHIFATDKKDLYTFASFIATDRKLELVFHNPEIICIEYVTDAHFKSGKMDQPDKYFCNVNDDLDELAENLGWIKYRKEGMKVWFDEVLLLVESAAQPSSEAIYTRRIPKTYR